MSTIKYKGYTVGSHSNMYSTSETQIGTWMDGKPVYRIIITGVMPDVANIQASYDITALNVETIVSVQGIASRTTSKIEGILPIIVGSGSNIVAYSLFCSPNITRVQRVGTVTTSWDGSNVRIILEYTKTTDQAVIP